MSLRLLSIAAGLFASLAHAQTPEALDLPLEDALRDRLVGQYALTMRDGEGPTLSLRLFVEDGALLGAIDGNDPTRMLYQGDRRFRPEDAPVALLTFPEAADGTLVVETPDGAMDGVRVADEATASEALFDELAAMDEALFRAGFAECDAEAAVALLDDDVEFYHDKGGASTGEAVHEAIRSQAEWCPRDHGVERVVDAASLHVSPIPGFGAVQTGTHRFVQATGTTVAQFAHVWRRTEDGWRVHRVLSFDHRTED